MSLIRWKKPCTPVNQDNNIFNHPFFGLSLWDEDTLKPISTKNAFSVDVEDTGKEFVVKADIPGVQKDKINISVENDVLTIKTERESEIENKDKNYVRVERSYGSFARSFNFGTLVDASKIVAKYNDGVLTVILPKSQESTKHEIKVED